MEIRIAPDPPATARLAAATLGRWLADGGTLGLAGGSTPRPTYDELRHQPVDWPRVTLWMTDERWVPPDHPDSNTAMARAHLADHVPARLLEVPDIGRGDPGAAAVAYDTVLGREIGERPDVVVLGVGDDGHTASLFPATAALSLDEGRYAANRVESIGSWRLTATIPYLQAARHLAFIVTGEAKAAVVAELTTGGSALPAAVVADGHPDVTWLLDEGAAGLL